MAENNIKLALILSSQVPYFMLGGNSHFIGSEFFGIDSSSGRLSLQRSQVEQYRYSLLLGQWLLEMPELQAHRGEIAEALALLRTGSAGNLPEALGFLRHQIHALLPKGVATLVFSASCESSPLLFAQGVVKIARVYRREGDFATPASLYSMALQALPNSNKCEDFRKHLEGELAALRGGGSFSDSLKLGLERASHELKSPMVLAMAAGSLAGPLSSRLLDDVLRGRMSQVARVGLSRAVGMGADAVVFTSVQHGIALASGQPTNALGHDLLHAGLMISSLRITGTLARTVLRTQAAQSVLRNFGTFSRRSVATSLILLAEYQGILRANYLGASFGLGDVGAHAGLDTLFTMGHFRIANAYLRLSSQYSSLHHHLTLETKTTLRDTGHRALQSLRQIRWGQPYSLKQARSLAAAGASPNSVLMTQAKTVAFDLETTKIKDFHLNRMDGAPKETKPISFKRQQVLVFLKGAEAPEIQRMIKFVFQACEEEVVFLNEIILGHLHAKEVYRQRMGLELIWNSERPYAQNIRRALMEKDDFVSWLAPYIGRPNFKSPQEVPMTIMLSASRFLTSSNLLSHVRHAIYLKPSLKVMDPILARFSKGEYIAAKIRERTQSVRMRRSPVPALALIHRNPINVADGSTVYLGNYLNIGLAFEFSPQGYFVQAYVRRVFNSEELASAATGLAEGRDLFDLIRTNIPVEELVDGIQELPGIRGTYNRHQKDRQLFIETLAELPDRSIMPLLRSRHFNRLGKSTTLERRLYTQVGEEVLAFNWGWVGVVLRFNESGNLLYPVFLGRKFSTKMKQEITLEQLGYGPSVSLDLSRLKPFRAAGQIVGKAMALSKGKNQPQLITLVDPKKLSIYLPGNIWDHLGASPSLTELNQLASYWAGQTIGLSREDSPSVSQNSVKFWNSDPIVLPDGHQVYLGNAQGQGVAFELEGNGQILNIYVFELMNIQQRRKLALDMAMGSSLLEALANRKEIYSRRFPKKFKFFMEDELMELTSEGRHIKDQIMAHIGTSPDIWGIKTMLEEKSHRVYILPDGTMTYCIEQAGYTWLLAINPHGIIYPTVGVFSKLPSEDFARKEKMKAIWGEMMPQWSVN